MGAGASPSWFQRFLLPGLAFKAVVIGGGYATGRELAEFFLGSGPGGGLAGMILAMLIWSIVCAVAFLFARAAGAFDYRGFFKALLGRFWILFEIIWLCFLVLILSVVAAAAGTIGLEVLGLPGIAGTLFLVAAIAGITSFGNRGAEQLFRHASVLIYFTYVAFVVLGLLSFGERIGPALALDVPADGWASAGVRYASYNVVAVVAVLPFVNMSSDPDNEFFSDGVTEEIINALTRVNGLKVTARTSSFAFKGHKEDIREIGERLGVTHVLEGSVRRAQIS
jgi:uncharacterized membrane protein YkvI